MMKNNHQNHGIDECICNDFKTVKKALIIEEYCQVKYYKKYLYLVIIIHMTQFEYKRNTNNSMNDCTKSVFHITAKGNNRFVGI